MRILLVEDEPRLRSQLSVSLQEAGYAIDSAADGRTAEFMGQVHGYDAVVLDLGLPEMDGLSVLRKWRASGMEVPVLILTARSTWHEKVEGIDAGADDYLGKPFRMEELLARLRALIRRATAQKTAELRHGPITLDTRSGRVTVDGTPVILTAHEFRVLSYLMHHVGEVVPRGDLVEHIYAQDFDRDSNTIEVFVARLRRKLGPEVIQTVRGLGYKLQ